MFNRVSALAVATGACALLAACGSDTYTPPPQTVMVPAPVVVPAAPVVVQPSYVPAQTTYVLPTAPSYVAPSYVAPTYVTPSYVAPVSPGNSPITEDEDIRRNAESGGK
jgi:hypothetical protein